jgi:glutathione peroxidase
MTHLNIRMNLWTKFSIVLLVLSLSGFTMAKSAKSVLDFTMTGIDGEKVELGKYKGKVLLVVNVASKCGLTPQYKELQEIYKKYKDKGFVVLGFPANNFLGQEPGSNKEIKKFCAINYGVEFPMFSKISVKGNDIHPLYRYLTGKDTNPKFAGEIRWNFDKFLVDKNGNVIHRFHPKTTPGDERVISAIEAALK